MNNRSDPGLKTKFVADNRKGTISYISTKKNKEGENTLFEKNGNNLKDEKYKTKLFSFPFV